jgi:hypothetical protein
MFGTSAGGEFPLPITLPITNHPDNLTKAGWTWGCVSGVDSHRQTIWIADALRDDGKRFVVRADDKLPAFAELESAIRAVSRPHFS